MPIQSLRTELVNGIQRIAEQTGRDLRLEVDSVIVELLNQYGDLPGFRDYVSYFGLSDLVATLRVVWHRRFEQGLKLIYESKSQTQVLCAFGSVVDLVHTLDQARLSTLENWCLSHALNSARTLAPSADPENSVQIPRDIVTALGMAFRSEGLKPTVQTYQLRRGFQGFPLRNAQAGLGGAPAIIAEALTELDVEASVYSMYHSIAQARCFRQEVGTQWLDLSTGQPIFREASRSGQPTHATRHTYALAYSEGVRLTSANIAAQKTDRPLLLLRPFNGRTPVTQYVVRARSRTLYSGRPEGPPEWPSLAGFVSWQLRGRSQSQLQIDFVPTQLVEQLGRTHHYVILNAPGIAQLQTPNDPQTAALLQQIQDLNRAGASLHLEISGGADPQRHSITPFAASLRGVVRSMGINHKELAQVTSLPGYPPQRAAPTIGPRTPEVFQRYWQALRLAQTLHLERLYVHGNDVDLILRRGASEASLQQEVLVDLFTKGAVIVSILLRNRLDVQTYPLPPVLYHEGFRALLEFAREFSRAQYPTDLRKRKALFKRIVNDGYVLAPGRDEYSVAIVPVMWPEAVRLDPSINTTGAGDICSGFSLIYSGWR